MSRFDLDIVERLRWDTRYAYGHVPVTMSDAAAEIERLRAREQTAEWVGCYFGLQRAVNMKLLPEEFCQFLLAEMKAIEAKLPPRTIDEWPRASEQSTREEDLMVTISSADTSNAICVDPDGKVTQENCVESMRLRWNAALDLAAELVVIYGSTSADLARQKILAHKLD